MKSTDIVQPHAMPSVFAEDVYSSTSTIDFAIPDATSTSATDTCVMDDGFLPITSEPLDEGGIAPERKNFNGLFYLSTDQRVFLQNGGFITFNADVSTAIGGYPQGAILGFVDANSNFSFVKSLIDDNTYNFVTTPSYIDGEYWDYASLKTDLSNAAAGAFENIANTAQSTGKATIADWISPDYSKAITVYNSSGGGSFNINWNGWLSFNLHCNSNSASYQFYIDGVIVGATASDENDKAAGCVMVKSGSVATWNGSQGIVIKKVPFVGGM